MEKFPAPDKPAPPPAQARQKLSFKEARELAALPERITALESEQRALTEAMCRPDYFAEGADRLRQDRARAAEIETELSVCLERWEALEQRSGG